MSSWYARTVFFSSSLDRSLHFHQTLGFKKSWHEGDGSGGVPDKACGLREHPLRRYKREDRGRLFISLDVSAMQELRRVCDERRIPYKISWWGYGRVRI